MARLGSDLQLQVQNLVLALRDITRKEREQLLERVKEDCSRVREDMSQTLSIQHYLASLLAETDPFLLIWVGTWCKTLSLLPAFHPSLLTLLSSENWLVTCRSFFFSQAFQSDDTK